MRGPLDWISRVVMLVLAGMVSLSIIGTIAAIPSGSIEGRIGLENQPARAPDVSPSQTAPANPEEDFPPRPAAEGPGTESGFAAPQPERADARIERWLEAITYALVALVGIAALATVLLWQGVRERRRIADSFEARKS